MVREFPGPGVLVHFLQSFSRKSRGKFDDSFENGGTVE